MHEMKDERSAKCKKHSVNADAMTDITPSLNECLKDKGAHPVLKQEYDTQRINSFLQEAYSIVWSLHQETRPATDE